MWNKNLFILGICLMGSIIHSSIILAQSAQFFCTRGRTIVVGSTYVDRPGSILQSPKENYPATDSQSTEITSTPPGKESKLPQEPVTVWRSYEITDKDLDGDGVPNELDSCPHTPWKFLPVNSHGCSLVDKDQDGCGADEDDNDEIPGPVECGCAPCLDDDLDGIHNRKDKCPQEPGSEANKGCPQVMNFPPIDSITFSSKDFNVSSDNLMRIKYKLKQEWNRNPNLNIFLIGLGDAATDGEQVYYFALKRIDSMKRKLSDWGFPLRMVSSEAQRSSPLYRLPRAVYIYVN